ncbi:MAG: hypothetical protein AAGK00_00550 [Pseudomonadota bacterium]
MTDQNHDQQPRQPDRQRPIETLRDGRISAAIWQNPGEHGPIYNATLSYSYQDKEGKWRDTQSIPGHELLKAANLAQSAYASVARLKEQDRAQYVQQQQCVLKEDPAYTHTPEHPRER